MQKASCVTCVGWEWLALFPFVVIEGLDFSAIEFVSGGFGLDIVCVLVQGLYMDSVPTAVARNPRSGDATTLNLSSFWSLRMHLLPPTLTQSLVTALRADTLQQQKYDGHGFPVDCYVRDVQRCVR